MGYLDVALRKIIQIAGTNLTEAKFFNFVSGVSGVYNPATGAIDLTVTGSAPAAPVAVAAFAIDWSLGDVFTKTLSGGSDTFTFANMTDGQTIVVEVTGDGGTLTWPTVRWASGTPPTQTSSGIDIYTFIKIGSTVTGSVVPDVS